LASPLPRLLFAPPGHPSSSLLLNPIIQSNVHESHRRGRGGGMIQWHLNRRVSRLLDAATAGGSGGGRGRRRVMAAVAEDLDDQEIGPPASKNR